MEEYSMQTNIEIIISEIAMCFEKSQQNYWSTSKRKIYSGRMLKEFHRWVEVLISY